jgi:tyrosinase
MSTGTSRRQILKGGLLAAASAALPGILATGARNDAEAATANRRGVRENVKNLSRRQKKRFVRAILELKQTRSPFDPSLSYYDQFVRFHQLVVLRDRLGPGYSTAHDCPAFLTWHRKLLMLFESAIRERVGNGFSLPYWDWTDASSLDVVFADDFMGPYLGDSSDNYAVASGPFRKGSFPVNILPQPIGGDVMAQSPFTFLTRGPKLGPLPTAEEVNSLMAVSRYDAPPYDMTVNIQESFRAYLNGIPASGGPPTLHSAVHAWVGGQWTGNYYSMMYEGQTTTFVGSMTALDSSPNDPVFWLNHCNVDRLWAIWEKQHGNLFEPASGWNSGWNLNDEMYPYTEYKEFHRIRKNGITNASMLDIGELGYTYDDL